VKIAIIGAGIFGVVIADIISADGHSITIFERQDDLFLGATGNSSNRLHLGFHYPRDIETAVQSLEGFKSFVSRYPDACNFEFPCIYALSKKESKTSLDSFLEFLDSAQLKAIELNNASLSSYGFATDRISRSWQTEEGVVDINVLKNLLIDRLRQADIKINLGVEIKRLYKRGNRWELEFDGGKQEYDLVVIATYGVDDIKIEDIEISRSRSIYQATLVLQAQISVPKFGMTVIDGDFITVLPKGFTSDSLIYAPGPSVIAESEDLNYVLGESTSAEKLKSKSLSLVKRYQEFFPEAPTEFSNNFLVTIRNLEMSTRATDKRVSRIEKLGVNLFSVRSGKIDHAILIGKEISQFTS